MLKELRKALAEKVEGLKEIKSKACAEDATDEAVKAFDDAMDEVEALQKQIARLERAEQLEKDASRPADEQVDNIEDGGDPVSRNAQDMSKMDQVAKMGLVAMSVTAQEFSRRDGDGDNALKILEDHGLGQFAKDIDGYKKSRKAAMSRIKSLSGSVNVSGGFLTPDNRNTDIIELLYPQTTFLQGGPRIVPMPNGVYRQPAGGSGASASYRQEGGSTKTTSPTFREINMSAKFLGAIVLMTQEMLDFSIPGAKAFIEGDLREAMGQEMDAKAYYGTGEGGEPLGIFEHDIQFVESAEAATPSVKNIDTDMDNLELAFLNKNLRTGNWRYVMAPRSKKFIGSRRVGDAGDGEFAFPEIRGKSPEFNDHPVLHSTNIPINRGAGADESDLALVNFSDVLLGLMDEMGFAASSEATISHNGQLVHLFQNNMVALRTLSGHDIALRRNISVAKLVDGSGGGITWGS